MATKPNEAESTPVNTDPATDAEQVLERALAEKTAAEAMATEAQEKEDAATKAQEAADEAAAKVEADRKELEEAQEAFKAQQAEAATKAKQSKDGVEVEVSRRVTKQDVLDSYNTGKNYYQLAKEFFGSENDESVARVRKIVEAVTNPDGE